MVNIYEYTPKDKNNSYCLDDSQLNSARKQNNRLGIYYEILDKYGSATNNNSNHTVNRRASVIRKDLF